MVDAGVGRSYMGNRGLLKVREVKCARMMEQLMLDGGF